MKQMEHTYYHMGLRVAALTCALLLIFDGGFLSPITKQLSDNTQQYIASAIGIKASVTPTELNTATAALTSRERELDQRESLLSEREISVGLGSQSSAPNIDISTYLLSVLLFIIIVLIVLNYALDFAREKRLLSLKLQNE